MRLTYIAFVLLGLFWGSNFIYMKMATQYITASQITLLRILFGFLPLLAFALQKRVLTRSQFHCIGHFAVMAVVATAYYYYAIVKGTALLPSGVAGILGGSIAIFTTIATLLFLRSEKLNGMMAGGVLLGFCGIALIARPWEVLGRTIDIYGVLWMLSATSILGVSYVYVRRFLAPYNLPPLALATWQTGLALIVLLFLTDTTGIQNILQDWHATAGVVVGLGVLGTGTAFLLYYYLLQELGAVAASGATYVTPIVALSISWIVGEPVGILEIGAVSLVIASIAMLQIGRQRAQRGSVAISAIIPAKGT
jgi:drug/metabolite transporter (DMT)-like permease